MATKRHRLSQSCKTFDVVHTYYWPVFAVATVAATVEREVEPRPHVDSLLRFENK